MKVVKLQEYQLLKSNKIMVHLRQWYGTVHVLWDHDRVIAILHNSFPLNIKFNISWEFFIAEVGGMCTSYMRSPRYWGGDKALKKNIGASITTLQTNWWGKN